jgi:hypothetical protein
VRNPQSVNGAERCLGMHLTRSGYEQAVMTRVVKGRWGAGGRRMSLLLFENQCVVIHSTNEFTANSGGTPTLPDAPLMAKIR